MAVAENVQPLAPAPAPAVSFSRRGQWSDFWRRYSRNRLAVVGLFIVGIWVFMGVFAPVIAPYNYRDQNLARAREMPSAEHWLGTDTLGRDQLSRLVWGARTSLIVAPLAVVISFSLGLFMGALAGYRGGAFDGVIMRVVDILLAFPAILFALLLASSLKPRFNDLMGASPLFRDVIRSGYAEMITVIIVLGLVGWPGLARLVRAQVLTVKNQPYVEAATATGTSSWRTLRSHIMPNIIAPVIVVLSMAMGGAIVTEVGLSFLGLGVEPPVPSWGTMINEGYFSGLWRQPNAPYTVWMPGIIVSLLVFAFAFIGDGLNEALNPQLDRGLQ